MVFQPCRSGLQVPKIPTNDNLEALATFRPSAVPRDESDLRHIPKTYFSYVFKRPRICSRVLRPRSQSITLIKIAFGTNGTKNYRCAGTSQSLARSKSETTGGSNFLNCCSAGIVALRNASADCVVAACPLAPSNCGHLCSEN